jgi:hypothetical protein
MNYKSAFGGLQDELSRSGVSRGARDGGVHLTDRTDENLERPRTVADTRVFCPKSNPKASLTNCAHGLKDETDAPTLAFTQF